MFDRSVSINLGGELLLSEKFHVFGFLFQRWFLLRHDFLSGSSLRLYPSTGFTYTEGKERENKTI